MSVKFSLGYPQFTKDPSYYYTLLKNSSQEYKDEISDIYFSVPFKYDGVSYGDCMSATSLEEHTKYLLKINNELNVKISLTFNEIPADPRIITTPEIFDAFIAGCVPVYWGAKNITDYVSSDCFIDRREFKNNQELYRYMKNMNDDEYLKYLIN